LYDFTSWKIPVGFFQTILVPLATRLNVGDQEQPLLQEALNRNVPASETIGNATNNDVINPTVRARRRKPTKCASVL
jgi:hypothetical protein